MRELSLHCEIGPLQRVFGVVCVVAAAGLAAPPPPLAGSPPADNARGLSMVDADHRHSRDVVRRLGFGNFPLVG